MLDIRNPESKNIRLTKMLDLQNPKSKNIRFTKA